MDESSIPQEPAWATGLYVETGEASDRKAVARYAEKKTWTVNVPYGDACQLDLVFAPGERLSPSEAFTVARELRTLKGVVYAEPTFSYRMDRVAGAKDDDAAFRATYILGMDRPELKTTWHLDLLRIPEARKEFEAFGHGVLIGHPDTGYTEHPEVIGRIDLERARDFLEGDNDPRDPLWSTNLVNVYNPGHGTGTGSLIVSPGGHQEGTEGERGIEGVAPEARLVPLRVTPMVAMTNTKNLADAIWYALENGMKVVSVSLGAPFPDRRTERILERAKAEGVIVCVAAGNVVRFVTYPGSSPNVLTVAGCTFERDPWFDSCRGAAVDVTAGAASVWVAHTEKKDGELRFLTGQGGGTSFAVATVAGLAALWISYHGFDSLVEKYEKQNIVEAFHRLIRKTANTFGKSYFASGKWGAGIPDAGKLLAAGLPSLADLRGSSPAPRFALGASAAGAERSAATLLGDLTEGQLPASLTAGPNRESRDGERHRLALQRLLGPGADELGDELAFHLSIDPELRRSYARAVFEGDGSRLNSLRKELQARGSEKLAVALKQAADPVAAPKKIASRKPEKTASTAKESEVPATRRLRVYAFDPSLATQTSTVDVSEVTLRVPWEADLEPGPVGEYVEVVDVDPASGCAYDPVDLNQHFVLAQDGLTPSEGNPQFHQQMVYAVAMETIQNFEQALGRRILWRHYAGRGGSPDRYLPRLRLYPHAIREANAFYSPTRRAILMGYFPAPDDRTGEFYPNGLVFTCLSQDIVAHEMTHAILDGLHPRFAEPSNPDVLAFHEAFADIVALFQRFSQADVLRHQIAQTRGDLRSTGNLLGQLAQQFGRAVGNHGALRRYVGVEADRYALDSAVEPHERGAILVAAIFDAFLTIYQRRIADLLRIATGGSGILAAGELHPDLVNRLALEAAKAAGQVLTICVRALNYCPPVDITFGEFLRALVTADFEQVQEDERGYRVAFIEAFRKRGIYPRDVRTLSEESLLWKTFDDYAWVQPGLAEGHELLRRAVDALETERFKEFSRAGRASRRTTFSDRLSQSLSDREQMWKDSRHAAAILHQILIPKDDHQANRSALHALGLDVEALAPLPGETGRRLKGRVEVHSVRSLYRVLPRGEIRNDLVIEITQWRRVPIDPMVPIEPEDLDGNSFLLRGGITIVYSRDTAEIRYVIRKNMHSADRETRQRTFLQERATMAASGEKLTALRELYFPAPSGAPANEPFALIHRGGQ